MPNDFKINEEDNLLPIKRKKTAPGIIGWLIKTGIVKTPGQANALLVGFIILGIGAIIYVNLKTFGG
jgi:hypothetical protein